jgi:hypothetical protein
VATTVTAVYPATADEVYRFLSDPERVRERCVAMGDHAVAVSRAGATVTCVRTVDADVPALLKKIVKPKSEVTEVKRWDEARRSAELRVDVRGVPVTVSGEIAVVPTASGCEVRMRFDVDARVPLVGGALARHVAGLTEAGFVKEHDWCRRRLAELSATRTS